MSDPTKDTVPGIIPEDVEYPRRPRPSKIHRGNILGRFGDVGKAIGIATVIVTATVAIVGWAFTSRVEAVENALQSAEVRDDLQDSELDVQNETLIGLRKDSEYQTKQLDWIIKTMFRQARADGLPVTTPPAAKTTPVPAVTP